MISDLTGKKVYLESGDYVGVIKNIFVDELGYTIAIIKTELDAMPEVRVNVITLKKIRKHDEDSYVLKSPPLKLVELIKEKKREAEIRSIEQQLELQKIKEHREGEKEKAEKEIPIRENWFKRLIDKIIKLIKRIIGKK